MGVTRFSLLLLLVPLFIFCSPEATLAAEENQNNLAELLYSAEDYESIGDLENALLYYDKAVAVSGDDTYALQKRAQLYWRSGKIDEAEKDYTRALKIKPEANIYVNRGSLYFAQQDNQRALKDYTAALKLDRLNETAYFNRGAVYRALKEYAKAIGDFNELIRINPSNSRYYVVRAGFYFESGDYQGALQDCAQALSLEERSDYYRNRAEVYRRLGEAKKAEADVAKADFLDRQEAEGK